MKCVLFSLFILGISFAQKNSGDSTWGKLVHPESYYDETVLRKVRSSNYTEVDRGSEVSTVITVNLPSFLDSINVEDVTDNEIQFKNVKASGLSSAHTVTYRIGFVQKKVDIWLGLSEAQIKGTYSISGNHENQEFVYNLYEHVALIKNISYALKDGKVTFGKGTSYFGFRKFEAEYSGRKDLKSISQKLLNASAGKFDAEVFPKLSSDLSEHILKVNAFKTRRDSAARIQKALFDCFNVIDDSHSANEELGVFYHDNTSFRKNIGNFDVKIPYFSLRGVEQFSLTSSQPSYSEKIVNVKSAFTIPEGAAMFDVHYRKANDEKSEYQVAHFEYYLSNIVYTFDISEKPNGPVELNKVTVHTDHIKVAPTQGQFGNELDELIRVLPEHLYVYVNENLVAATVRFINGFFADHLNKGKRSIS